MSIVSVNVAEQYQKLIASDKVSVVLFSADWAEQCKQILDVMTDLSKKPEYSAAIQFLNVPAEELSDVSLKHQIEAVPTVLFIRSGMAIDRIDGVDIASLSLKCKSFVDKNASAGAGDGDSQTNLNDRLKALINRAKVMIFMKGDRNTPRCGFSKQLIQIINETKVNYDTFDILTDEEVRQGLKVYSDWPTYPQVYVAGELIGGLDIIKELVENNELVSTLNG
ncbi:glutaredoxin 3 [Sitodiplosis mosellana]|uniref:glutaredoxin 3 n=1 Tax=Sitodiplosis mosellana TaxID=263140 RepID=UPI0024450507|nr:glutaredoxin 3 [Sitodiplosis mosellana]